MRTRAPQHWFDPPERPGWRAILLDPLGRFYAFMTRRRLLRAVPVDPGVPVICVGNLNAGGTGKTPTVIALAERLKSRGQSVHVVSRGYGGTLKGPVRVDPAVHLAAQTGDEPLLMAATAPTWVARNRVAGCRAAARAGASVILLDDGHQDPSVAKALSIVVVDAARGFGNGRCIPAGPLREPVGVGLARAQVLLTIGAPLAQDHFGRSCPLPKPPRVTAALVPLQTGMRWDGMRVLAFAGIGHPEKFFETLRGLGALLARVEPLDDHQALTQGLMARLQADADALGAELVTTEKDAVRLPAAYRGKVLTLPVRLQIDDWSVLDGLMAEARL